MPSFIELPRLGFRGIDQPSLYVNTADIVAVQTEYDGQVVVVEIRGYGTEGAIGKVRTYVPLVALLDGLEDLATRPGIRDWTEATKATWAAPVKATLEAAADRERAASARA